MTRRALRRPFPEWHSGVRRRTRSVLRVYGSAHAGLVRRDSAIVPAYWWDGTPNFGDALTPWLLPRHGLTAVHADPAHAVLAGVGSILEQLPRSFSGTVWGSGLLYGEPLELPQARFAAVRGRLTHEALGLDASVVLGDPGLLIRRHSVRRRPRWRLGLVPHHAHVRNPDIQRLAAAPGVTTIDVTRSPGHVISRIAACETVLSTSLHGLVTADALGIPAAWAMADPQLWGGDFKFRDHESVVCPDVDRRTVVDTAAAAVRAAALADRVSVESAATALEDALHDVPVRRGVPALAWRYR